MKRKSEDTQLSPNKRQFKPFVNKANALFEAVLKGEELGALWSFYEEYSEEFAEVFAELDREKCKVLLNKVHEKTGQPFFWTIVDDAGENSENPASEDSENPFSISIEKLIDCGADFDSLDFKGNNLLHFLGDRCSENALSLILDLEDDFLIKFKYLAEKVNYNNETPLHAVMNGNEVSTGVCISVVSSLIKLGVNPNQKDNDSRTPLHSVYLCSDDEIRSDIIESLVEGGAGLDVRDSNGDTPFSLAIKMGWFIQELATDELLYEECSDNPIPFFLIFKVLTLDSDQNIWMFEEAFKFFINKMPINDWVYRDVQGNSLLLYCARYASPLALKHLLDHIGPAQMLDKNYDGLGVLANALLSRRLDNVKLILEYNNYWMLLLEQRPDLLRTPFGSSIFSLFGTPEINAYIKDKIGEKCFEGLCNPVSDCYGMDSKIWQPLLLEKEVDKKVLSKARHGIRQSFDSNLIRYSRQSLGFLMVEFFQVQEKDPIFSLLSESMNSVFILNQEHMRHFSIIFECGLKQLYLRAQSVPLLRLFLEKNLELLQKHPKILPSYFLPWIKTLKITGGESLMGIYYIKEQSSWVEIQKKSESTLSCLIHEWVHRMVDIKALNLDPLKPFWEKVLQRIGQKNFVRPEHLSLEVCRYNEELMKTVLIYKNHSGHLEEIFARFFESIVMYGNDSLEWYEAQLPGKFRELLVDLISAQKEPEKEIAREKVSKSRRCFFCHYHHENDHLIENSLALRRV